jgi:hypothetical protein
MLNLSHHRHHAFGRIQHLVVQKYHSHLYYRYYNYTTKTTTVGHQRSNVLGRLKLLQYNNHHHHHHNTPSFRLHSSTSSGSNSNHVYKRTTITGATNTGTDMNGKKVIQIPAHVLTFTILFIPCTILAIYVSSYGPNDEMVQQKVREKYGNNRMVQEKNAALKEFFINAEQGIEDERLQQVLYGGKGEKKRLHAIDTELYGTEHGVIVKEQTINEIQTNIQEKKQRKKELRRLKRLEKQQLQLQQQSELDGTNQKKDNLLSNITSSIQTIWNNNHETIKTTVTYTILGTIAITIGFIAGNSNSRGRR